jgi:hypothetical protein
MYVLLCILYIVPCIVSSGPTYVVILHEHTEFYIYILYTGILFADLYHMLSMCFKYSCVKMGYLFEVPNKNRIYLLMCRISVLLCFCHLLDSSE